MSVNTVNLLKWLQHVRTKATDHAITGDQLHLHQAVATNLIEKGTHLNFVISAAKVLPAIADIKSLTDSCLKNAPELIDSLLCLEGVNRRELELGIVARQHPSDSLARITGWYAGAEVPAYLQSAWAENLHAICRQEASSGTAYQRRLTPETCSALDSALNMLGGQLTDQGAATWVFRSAHYALRGMVRIVPLLHTLSSNFTDTALSRMWDFSAAQTTNRDEWRLNAQAFTLANSDAFPDARSWLTVNYPKESTAVFKLWDKSAMIVSNYFASERSRFGVKTTIVQRDGDWQEPDVLLKNMTQRTVVSPAVPAEPSLDLT